MQGDTLWKLMAIPLTPIHIGDGTAWQPDEFDIRDGRFLRFNPHRVLAAMPAGARRQFVSQLDNGQLKQAQATLRGALRDELVEERLPMSGEARRALGEALLNPGRRGEVQAFVRSGGRPYLPGSSLKGALRTALLSARVGRLPGASVHAALTGGDPKRASDRLQDLGFAIAPGRTEQDPLRDVAVPDVPLPQGRLKVDRVFHWQPGTKQGDEIKDMQIHVERLLCRADGPEQVPLPPFQIRLGARARQQVRSRLDPERSPEQPVTGEELWEAVRSFHWARFDAERHRFWSRRPALSDRLDQALTLPQKGAGPATEARHRSNPRVALVRLGRFGHFESKSIETYRQGHIPQRKTVRQPGEEGGTRMLATVPGENGEADLIPFGWLLLYRTD